MRAFAVIMMIQGHTVDAFLGDEFRNLDSFWYLIWHSMRGFTAPIFMFTAGLIFTYLLKSEDYDFSKNPRIKKGIKRGLMLIGIGYLLRYPTHRIFDFSYVSQKQWDIFFAVDALHLIGFGLLVIIFAVFFARRAHINLNFIFFAIIFILLLTSPIISTIEWNNFFPQYISSYFTKNYGSLFPIFPWLIYVIAGAILGNYLYKNDEIYLKKRFSLSLSLIGLTLILFSTSIFYLENNSSDGLKTWFFVNGFVFLRVGFVLVINSLMAFIVRKFNSVPKIISNTGKKTLMLYVLHVIILFGCAWFPGLYKYYAKAFNPIETIIAALLMLGLMLSIVQFTEKLKIFRKGKIALTKV